MSAAVHQASPAPTVALRTTAGRTTGLGHLRRCLTLADELRAQGATTVFWLDGDEVGADLARSLGHEVRRVTGGEPGASLSLCAAPPDGLVVDSYGLDEGFFRALRPRVGALLVLDDLADRHLEADLVLNAGGQAASLAYRVGAGCALLLGPSYALLRPRFRDRPARGPSTDVSRVLVTLGGGDPEGRTIDVVGALLAVAGDFAIDVVLGPLFGDPTALTRLASSTGDRLRLHHAPPDLSDLMTEADLAISAGGQTLFELAACGLPAVALCLADNQREQLAAFARVPTLIDVGDLRAEGFAARLRSGLEQLFADPALRLQLSRRGQALIDGRGAERAASALLSRIESPRTGG